MSKDLKNVINLFQSKPYLVEMGAATVAKRFNLDIQDILEARKIVRQNKQKFGTTYQPDEVSFKKINKGPKILVFDIETAPLRAYVWKRWKENISLDQTLSEWFILTFSAKWLHSNEVLNYRLTGEEVLREDDSKLVKKLWDLFNEADVVIAHNAKCFDVPKSNSRFLANGLFPPSAYKIIDTLEVSKRQFGFSSNKLDALATLFGIPCKLSTGFDLWARCMQGDEEALTYMSKYCGHDVEILEEVYLRLLPYIKNHPNYNLYVDEETPVCPSCGGKHLSFSGYYYFTSTTKYENYRCEDCGALSRNRKSILKNKKHILINN